MLWATAGALTSETGCYGFELPIRNARSKSFAAVAVLVRRCALSFLTTAAAVSLLCHVLSRASLSQGCVAMHCRTGFAAPSLHRAGIRFFSTVQSACVAVPL